MPLIVAATFVITFVAVCAIAYVLLKKRRSENPRSPRRIEFGLRLPVSERSFERIADATRAAVSPPPLSEETRDNLDGLQSLRRGLVSIYRVTMIAVGVAGLIGGGLLLRSHTPANMNALPGAIICLLALGALLSGLVPGPSVRGIEPLDPDLIRQFRDKVKVQVITTPPLEVKLGASEIRQLKEMLRGGEPISAALRAVYPGYDRMDESERRWLETTLQQHVRDLE